MKNSIKLFLLSLSLGMSFSAFSQAQNIITNPTEDIKLNAEKVKKYTPFVQYKHGGDEKSFANWKNSNKILYAKEMWYYSESFYIKRNVNASGITMNEAQLDISRFEKERKENEEATVVLPGYKDVIVLLPNNKLIYKPL